MIYLYLMVIILYNIFIIYMKSKKSTNRKNKRNTKKNIRKKRNTKRKIKKRNYKKTGSNKFKEEFKDIYFFREKIEEMSNIIMNQDNKAKLIFNDIDRINNRLEILLSNITSIENLHELYGDTDNDSNNALFLIYFIFSYYILIATDKDDYDEDYIEACNEIASNIYNYLINVLEGEEFELISNDFELEVVEKYLKYFQKKYKV